MTPDKSEEKVRLGRFTTDVSEEVEEDFMRDMVEEDRTAAQLARHIINLHYRRLRRIQAAKSNSELPEGGSSIPAFGPKRSQTSSEVRAMSKDEL